MITQQKISKEINSSYRGKEVEVLVDEISSGKSKLAIGHMEANAPEIDADGVFRDSKFEKTTGHSLNKSQEQLQKNFDDNNPPILLTSQLASELFANTK